jgi:hypothetical protein
MASGIAERTRFIMILSLPRQWRVDIGGIDDDHHLGGGKKSWYCQKVFHVVCHGKIDVDERMVSQPKFGLLAAWLNHGIKENEGRMGSGVIEF